MVVDIRYEIILNWSKEDQAFIAMVPQLAGCAADGATYQEALSNVEAVIREWIETAKELGHAVPEPRGREQVADSVAQARCEFAVGLCQPMTAAEVVREAQA